MEFRVRVPIILGLLIASGHSSASAQINSGYFTDGAPLPVTEPFYDNDCFTTGCYLDPGPCWLGQVTFDVLMLDRSDADPRTIVREPTTFVDFGPGIGVQPVLGAPRLNTTDLGFPVNAGYRLNLVLPGDDGCDLVINYLGSAFAKSRVHDPANASYDHFELAGRQPANGDPFRTIYESHLRSVEINSRTRQWSWLAPLAGVRFIQLEEDFDRDAADGTGFLRLTNADNRLWGFQIGGESMLYDGGPLRLQSTIKAGVFYNDLNLSTGGEDVTVTDALTMQPRTVEGTQSFPGTNVAYFGEVNLELAYRVCPQIAIRVGYTAMWLDGVALAPDQHDNFVLGAGIGTFDYGTVLYHGSYVGAEFTW